MISNHYGSHVVGDRTVSKGTVFKFFVDRVLAGEPLTAYEPGSQARNFVHVPDVAETFVSSADRFVEQRTAGETGAETFEVASHEEPGVKAVAELVAELAREERGLVPEVRLGENPRRGETLVEALGVGTVTVRERLGWALAESIREPVRELLRT